MWMKNKKNGFLLHGGILALSSILVRIIGLVYRIPMTNIIGDRGNAYYSSAYSIYSVMLLFSSYSLPTAMSKLISHKMGRKEYENVYRYFIGGLFFALCMGSFFASITWFGAEFLAVQVSRIPLAVIPLRVLAPTVFIMAFLGVMRGLFQGMQTMLPTAFSQIIEQILNAIVSVVAALSLFQLGKKAAYIQANLDLPYAYGAAGGTLGTSVGALAALIFCLVLYMGFRKTLHKRRRMDVTGRVDSASYIGKVIVLTVIPIILSTAVYNLIDLVDMNLFGRYMHSSSDHELLWGAYSGKFLLLVRVPIAFASALAAAIVPAISAAMSKKNRGEVLSKTSLTLKITLLIALPCAVGFTVLGKPIVRLLFPRDTSSAGLYLMIGSVGIVFYSISTVTNAILQGINHLKDPVRHSAISLGLHILLVIVLMWGFRLGIYAIVVGYVAFALFMCVQNIQSIRRYLNFRTNLMEVYAKPVLCSLLMGCITGGTYFLFVKLLHKSSIATLLSILIAVPVYFVLLFLLRAVRESDLLLIPGGRKMLGIARKLRLL